MSLIHSLTRAGWNFARQARQNAQDLTRICYRTAGNVGYKCVLAILDRGIDSNVGVIKAAALRAKITLRLYYRYESDAEGHARRSEQGTALQYSVGISVPMAIGHAIDNLFPRNTVVGFVFNGVSKIGTLVAYRVIGGVVLPKNYIRALYDGLSTGATSFLTSWQIAGTMLGAETIWKYAKGQYSGRIFFQIASGPACMFAFGAFGVPGSMATGMVLGGIEFDMRRVQTKWGWITDGYWFAKAYKKELILQSGLSKLRKLHRTAEPKLIELRAKLRAELPDDVQFLINEFLGLA